MQVISEKGKEKKCLRFPEDHSKVVSDVLEDGACRLELWPVENSNQPDQERVLYFEVISQWRRNLGGTSPSHKRQKLAATAAA